MSSPPSLPASPPPKRLKTHAQPEFPVEVGTEIHSQTSAEPFVQTALEEAPVKALFVPTGASQGGPAGPSNSKQKARKRKQKRPVPEVYSPADVLFHDIKDFLGKEFVEDILAKGDQAWEAPEDLHTQSVVELRVGAFTVSGESISAWPQNGTPKWAIIAPFAHPGDLIRAKIYRHDRLHSVADLVEIIEYSETYRGGEGDRRKYPENGCKYFGECGGCQLQPLPYQLQLAHKKRTVQLAYQRYFSLDPSLLPEVKETIPSPKQWGYRTKITPHFDAPPKWSRAKAVPPTPKAKLNSTAVDEEASANGAGESHSEETAMNALEGGAGVVIGGKGASEAGSRKWECRIGFERKGRPGVMDIEECPIATPVLNAKLTPERARINDTIMSFTKGATLLLRDSLPAPEPLPSPDSPFDPSTPVLPEDQHVAITNHKLPVYERVGSFLLSFAAGSFFQNNNSILVPLTEYVREAIFPSSTNPTSTISSVDSTGPDPANPNPVPQVGSNPTRPTHLVDAYCGSGLFGITLSPHFERVAGVEISQDSITAAKKNAEMNGLGEKTEWLCGKAEDIFGGLPEKGFEGSKSCVVVDPPRKGCDEPFLKQLLDFKPITVVYVSCNVHTQARDVGWLLREADARGVKYVVESLRGFDLFPQTAHVESVAVLRLQ
ncbi:hypothetical protein JCM24511_09419 [Saitozyma sp. JCM 24511]|nr:hypothetical protein JCM24511_09419 [Saitozyma sp. JCM 24511]